MGYGKQSSSSGRQEEMTLKDPDSPEHAQPCGTHCYLVPTGEPGSATRGGPERALRWGRHTDLGALWGIKLPKSFGQLNVGVKDPYENRIPVKAFSYISY